MNRVFMGTKMVDAADCLISAFERGYLYADGIFETVRIRGGVPRHMDRHLERMKNSASFFSIPMPVVDLAKEVEALAAENGLLEGAARITLSRGPIPSGPRPASQGARPTLLITVRPLPPDFNLKKSEGVSCRTLPWPMRAGGLPLEGHKTLAYLGSVLALGTAGENEEPLLETLSGHISEGATSNLFWVKDGVLFTPSVSTGCLPGITRARVIETALERGVRVSEGHYWLKELKSADEAFLTNAVMGMIPVRDVDRTSIGKEMPGPLTRELNGILDRDGP